MRHGSPSSTRPGDHVVHVGAGSGYYTAMLALLVEPGGRVDAFEVHEGLAEAERNLEPYRGSSSSRNRRSAARSGRPTSSM